MKDEWKDARFAARWDMREALRTNPDRPEQLDLLVSLLAGGCRAGDTILDLGCGSGQVEDAIFRRIPGARVVGVDSSEAMMRLARARLAPYGDRFTAVPGDFATLAARRLPARRYGAAISVQALHEVPHAVKRRVFALVREILPAGGTFFLLDRLRCDFEGLFQAYRSVWDRLARRRSSAPMSFAAYRRRYRDKGDHVATPEEHLAWLRACGFGPACVYLHFNRALFVARRVPDRRPRR